MTDSSSNTLNPEESIWGRLVPCIQTLNSVVINKEPFKIGRSARCDFVIEEQNVDENFIGSISKVHFMITRDPHTSVMYLTDLSKNGTYICGSRLKKCEKTALRNGDEIAIGQKNFNVFTFQTFEDLPDTKTGSPTLATNMQIDVLPWGRLISCMMYLNSYDILKNEFKLGRSQRCDVVVERLEINQNIKNIFSKEHFVIYKDPDNPVAFIKDLSKTGTHLNNQLIGKNNTVILQNDDMISIGISKLQVYVYKCMYSQDMNYLPPELKKKYEPATLLGRGAAGEVRLAFEKFTCKMVAIKKILKSRSTLSQVHKLTHPSKIQTEINILKTLKHPCIMTMRDICNTPDEVYIVLDYMKGGELTNRIFSTVPLSESNVKFLFYQIVLAVQFLHSKGITHRDLKPENVLLFSEEIETLVKVSDFGLSKITEGEDMMTTVCGTMNYIAPEVLDGRIPEYNKQVDVWSLGVILFYMLSKRLPFKDSDKSILQKLIITGYYIMEDDVWHRISVGARDLIKKMLNVKPQKRISVLDILKHPWLARDADMQYKLESLIESNMDPSEEIIMTYDMEPPMKRFRLSSDETMV
ncbi:hypothetical protein JTB14_000069 [Gonioctena quinquepunctata]|nr:hypothetical protein JTB14_000069 [Gonioctena quinquepunctata]